MTAFAFACRLIAKRPALALARVLTVTTVVAAGSAVFAIANAILLRPLPFPEPHRLVRVYFQPPGTSSFADADSLDAFAFVRLRERVRALDAVVGIFASDRGITGDGEPESVNGGAVTDGFFPVLGGRMVLGRAFTTEEHATAARLVVLSHGLWIRKYGGDPSVVGRVLVIDRQPHTVVGVTASDFEPAFARSEFWTPLDLRTPNPYFSGVQTVGRLRPGVSVAQASADFAAVLPTIAKEVPEAFRGWTLKAIDLREAQYGSRRPTIGMLLAAVLGLALIAIANLANLTLADILSRRIDFAVRAALGGSRRDLAAPEIVQSLLLAVAGGLAGFVLARWIAVVAIALDPWNRLSADQVRPDWRVIAWTFGLAWAVMLVAVGIPSLRAASPQLGGELTTGSRRAIGHRSSRRIRVVLIAAQTALGIILLATGVLVAATFQQASRIDPGFDPHNLVSVRLRLSEIALPTQESRGAFIERLLAKLRETPGVTSASTTLNWFAPGLAGARSLAFVEDRPNPDGSPYSIQSRRNMPRYFETMRIPILSGRDFQETDRLSTQSVAIVSRGFAERFWPGASAIGRRVKRGVTTKDWAIVVGVVEDVRDVRLGDAPRDTLYTPFLQSPVTPIPVTLVVRTEADVRGFIGLIKRRIWEVDPDQPLANVIALDDFLDTTVGPQRFRALLVGGYAVIGLLLATIGTYAVTARSVVERTREAGVRIALGGSPHRVWLTLASGTLQAVAAGAVLGTAGAWGSALVLRSVLPELRDMVWLYAAVAAATLVIAGSVATLTASRRIVRIDPARTLHSS